MRITPREAFTGIIITVHTPQEQTYLFTLLLLYFMQLKYSVVQSVVHKTNIAPSTLRAVHTNYKPIMGTKYAKSFL